MCDNPLPDSWTNTPLSDFASDEPNSFVDGPFGSDLKVSDYTDEGVRILQLQNLGDGHFIDDNVKFTSNLKAVSLSRCLVKPGDLLIAKMADPLARACIVPTKVEHALIVADLIKLRLGRQHDATFIASAINGTAFRREAERLSTGTTRTRISLSTLKRIRLKAPPPYEQRRIGTVIRTLDEAIEQTEALIAKHQQIKTGLMHDLFTRGVTPDGHLRPTREQAPDLYKESPLGWIPKAWEVVELKSEIGIAHGFAFSGEYFSDTPPGEVLLTPGNFHRDGGLYFTAENTKYFQGSIPPTTVLSNGEMVTVMTDLSPQTLILGRFAIVDTPFPLLHNQRIGRVILKRKDRWDWGYLCSALNNERVRRKIIVEATGTTVRHTSPVRILGNQVARPHLEEQQRSIEVLRSIERRLVVEQAELLKSKLEKHGLMHDLLTGRVRVPMTEQ